MTTPNGKQQHDPNGSSQQATSTVLALDGWGPVVVEPIPNGSNGSEPEIVAAEAAVESIPASDHSWRDTMSTGWRPDFSVTTTSPRWTSVVVPAMAIAVATFVTLRFGVSYPNSFTAEVTPLLARPDRIGALRRTIALAIDPTLTPEQPKRHWLLEQLDRLAQFSR